MTIWLAQSTAAAAGATGDDKFLMFGLILMGVSLVLLFLELFIPSGGLISILAAVAAIGSVVAFYKYDSTWGMVATGAYIVLGPIVAVFGFRWWINSPLGRRMILGGNEPGVADLDDDSPMSEAHARQERLAQLRQLIGAQGVTVTSLRPVGIVKINGQRIDALAESGVIDAGQPVTVTDVYDNQIKVRAV